VGRLWAVYLRPARAHPMAENVFTRVRGDWSRLAALLIGPPLILSIWLWLRYRNWTSAWTFVDGNWGNIASAWGLSVGVYVLMVAQGARRAAEQARQLGRARGLLEELEEANKKIQLVGVFIGQRKWDLVNHVAGEVLVSCKGIMARWNDLPGSSSNTLLEACVLIRSIADSAIANVSEDQTAKHARRLLRAQLSAAELLSTALGHGKQLAERKDE